MAKMKTMPQGSIRDIEVVPIETLKPHPRNYKNHPEDQLKHLGASLKEHGFFRNVVVAKDSTILAGHGVVEAAVLEGFPMVPVMRLSISPTSKAALKVLALDNELPKFAETDDRALSELLKEIRGEDALALLGTGYDDKMLAALAMVTRPAAEVADRDAASEWVGMPEYIASANLCKLIVTFDSDDERRRFVEQNKLKIYIANVSGRHPEGHVKTWSARWPTEPAEDPSTLKFR